MTKEIGGFFELELPKGDEYHNKAIALNSGRNCLLYAIKSFSIKKIFYPYFNCETMLYAIQKYNPDIDLHYYHIDGNFKPILPRTLGLEEWVLFINYYGICSNIIPGLSQQTIIDNSQAFFTKPYGNQPTFYSPRKFFGVPDGGYLYAKYKNPDKLDREVSHQRSGHLLKRIDLSAGEAYIDFLNAENSIAEQPSRMMSRLTHRILSSIDYDFAKHNRRKNFYYLYKSLSENNELTTKIALMEEVDSFVPFVYPFMTTNGNNLRQKLINNNIFVPKYWPPSLLNYEKLSPIEINFVNNVVPLPVDQRYDLKDMDRILSVIHG